MAGGWGRPGLDKLTCYVAPPLREAMRIESAQRHMTLGELIEEVFSQREPPQGMKMAPAKAESGMVVSRTVPIGSAAQPPRKSQVDTLLVENARQATEIQTLRGALKDMAAAGSKPKPKKGRK